MSEPRDALIDMVKSPGWAQFVAHCEQEWGVRGLRYHAELDKALNLTDPAAAHAQALQVRAARTMMETLIRWPEDEINRLARIEEEPAGTGRRGGY